MPFSLMRMASVLAAGFLFTGSSYTAAVSASTGATSADNVRTSGMASCPAQWTADRLPVPPIPVPPPRSFYEIKAATVISPTDVWMLGGQFSAYVLHLVDGRWEDPLNLSGNDPDFLGLSIVASSDADVWVVGDDAGGIGAAWHYDGSTWTEHAPPKPFYGEFQAAALGPRGMLYMAGYKGTGGGGVWSFDGAQWKDLTPATTPATYDTLAVTAGGTLVAGGYGSAGSDAGGMLQVRSGTTWTTVPLPSPVSVRGISVAPGGTVYAVGSETGNEAVLIELPPGSRSAIVRDVPTPVVPGLMTGVAGVVAVGPGDVWVLGAQPTYETPRPWVTHFDGSRFVAASTPVYSDLGEYFLLMGGVSLGSDVLAFGEPETTRTDQDFSMLLAVCPVRVTSDAIVPPRQRMAVGSQMFWSIPATAASWHELVAPGIFDSGPIEPGGSFAYDFFAASTYAVKDTDTGATQTVRVSPVVTPASGATSTVYTIDCATLQAPAGYAYRLLIRPPGSSGYTLLTTTSQPATTFLPYRGTGTYRFECQVQTPEGVNAASPPAAAQVS